MSDYLIEKLDVKKHDREKFNCGVPVLNSYLRVRANQEQKKRLNVVYVAVPESKKKRIIGYCTMSNGSIALSKMTPGFRKGVPATYDIPIVKIGRLGVDVDYQRKGVGRLLLKNAFKSVYMVALLSGVNGVAVNAKNEMAIKFYKKFGFQLLNDSKRLLFLPIKTISQAFSS